MGKSIELDEEGLPIPQKVKVPKSSVEFDEDGLPVPIKKKEPSGVGSLFGGIAGTSVPQSVEQRLTDFIQGTKTKPTKEDYATAIAKGKPVLLKQGQQIGSDFGQQINKEAEKEQLISKASGIPSIPSIENNIIKQGGDKTSSWYENTQQKYSNKLKEIEDVTKYQFDNIIAEAERQSGDNITVPKDKTSLPNQSFLGVVGGNVTVDRKEFIKEWQTKKQEWLKNENVEVEKLKTRADQALDATTESMKPILEYAANNLSVYSKKNNDGVIVADPNEIDKLAQRTAAKYGVAGDGLYKKLIYNKITENINHAIIKPEVDKVFESKVKDAFGGKSLDDVMGDEYKAQVENLSEVTKITNSTKNDISVVSEKIKQDAQGEVGRINELAKAEIEEIKKQYNEVANTATTQEELDNTNAIFNKRIEEVGLKFLSDQNEINSRFNKIYTESINGITRVATKRLEDIAKSFKYKPSDELQAKIKNLYNDSYTSVIDKRGEAAEIRDAKKTWIGEGIAKMTTQLGGAIKNQATSLGWDAGEIIGDVLSSSYTPSSSELDSWKDIFNPRKLVTSGMSLAGGMLPTIAGTAAVTATTGGAGTPAALRMALAAITSFTFDTAQQMGSVWNEKFSETGNLSDANKAAKTMLDGQKAIMWTYAGSGLPFMGSSVKLAKNRAARVLLGIGIQHTSETGQEWFQDAVETAAIEGKSLKDAMGNLTWDRLKNNSLQIAPLSIFMGGGGQVGGILSEASKNRAMKANGEAFALKSEFNKLAPSQMNQFLFDMIQRQGMPFSKGYVASLFTSGHIDKTQLVEMQNLLSNSETLIKNANTYGLTPAQQKVYFWLDANKNKAIEDVAAQTDPIFIKAAEAKVKAIEQDMVNLASGEKVDYTVLTYPNNEQYVLSNQEAEQALKGNQFLSAYKNGDIKIETFGKRGAVQEQLDEIDSKKEPVKGHMAFEGSELNELETKAIEGLQGKDFAGSPIKPYTDVIQNPEASIEDKKEALKGLSDQLTAKGTEVVVGTALGKEADLIYDLGYEVAQESEALQKLQSEETKIEEPTVSEKKSILNQGTDLLGNDKELWMFDVSKSNKSEFDSRGVVTDKGELGTEFDPTVMFRGEIKIALNEDKFEKAIKDGRMTASDAKTIIENAGLEVPQDILIDAGVEKTKISPTVSETEGAGSSGVGGDVKAKNKAFEELVNLIPTTDLRRPNGSIGTQGFSPENLVEVARHIAKEMGFDIPAYDKNKGTSEIKQVIDYLKNNKEAQQKIRDYVVKDPVVVSLLPDNTYEIEDGNHRANLLNLIGVDVIPTIELNGRDKQTAINEHNSKVEAVEQSLKAEDKAPVTKAEGAGSSGVGGDVEMTYEEKKTDIEKRRQEELSKFQGRENWGKREEINQEHDAELDKLRDNTPEGIEEKRQEHLKKSKQDHPDNWGQTTDNGDGTTSVNYTGKKFNDGMSVEATFVDMGGVGDMVDGKYVPVENPYEMIIGTDKPAIMGEDGVLKKGAVVRVGKFKDKAAADEWLKNEKEKRIESQPKRESKINAKYDAELKAVEQSLKETSKAETPTSKGNTSNVVGGVVDLNVAQKYTINAANKDLPQAKEVDKNLIDWEASGLDEFDTEVDKVKVLETRGKNAQGQAVGTVRVYLKDGSIENFEVKFKETSKGNTSNVVEGSVGVGGDVEATTKALDDIGRTQTEEGDIIDKILLQKSKDLREEDGTVSDKNLKEFKDVVSARASINAAIAIRPKAQGSKERYVLSNKEISEAYHKAKADGTNPELLKAVEQSLKAEDKAPVTKPEGKSDVVVDKNADIEKLGKDFVDIINQVGDKEAQGVSENDRLSFLKSKLEELTGFKVDELSKEKKHFVIKVNGKEYKAQVSTREAGGKSFWNFTQTEIGEKGSPFNVLNEWLNAKYDTGNIGVDGKSILNSDVDLKGGKKEKWMEVLPKPKTKDDLINEQGVDIKKTKDRHYSEIQEGVNSGDIETKGNDYYVAKTPKGKDILSKVDNETKLIVPAAKRRIETARQWDLSKIAEHRHKISEATEGKFQKAIEDGKMAATDAKKIIESAGLEVPKDILEQSQSKQESGGKAPVTKPNEKVAELEAERDMAILREKVPEMGNVNEVVPTREAVSAGSSADNLTVNKRKRAELKNRYTELQKLLGCLMK